MLSINLSYTLKKHEAMKYKNVEMKYFQTLVCSLAQLTSVRVTAESDSNNIIKYIDI